MKYWQRLTALTEPHSYLVCFFGGTYFCIRALWPVAIEAGVKHDE